LEHTPPGEVREGIERAASIEFDTSVIPDVRILDHGMSTVRLDVTLVPIVRALGNGSRITCQDTVPFCLWVAGRHLDGYEAAIITTIRAGGDVDTNCAIVGGIVALAVGREGIPRDWLADREQLVV
jgi:hypothetical protein